MDLWTERSLKQLAIALSEWESKLRFSSFFFICHFNGFCMQRASLGAIKLVPLKQKILIHINLHRLPHVPFTLSYCKRGKGKWGKRHSVMTLFQFLCKRVRVVHTQTSNLICNCAADEKQHTKKCEWGRFAEFYKSFRENASFKLNQKMRRFNKNVNSWNCRSSFLNFTHEPSQHPLPSRSNKNQEKLAKCWFQWKGSV